MGRTVKIRVSYQDDAAHLTRLVRAVELDTVRPEKWKEEVIAHLNSTIVLFLTPVTSKPVKAAKRK